MLKKICSVFLIISILFSFCNFTNANYKGSINNKKFTKEDYKEISNIVYYLKENNIEIFRENNIEKYKDYKYETRGAKSFFTKEALKNLASSIRDLSYNTYFKWFIERGFGKESASTFLEYIRTIAYKVENSSKLLKVAENRVKYELIYLIQSASSGAISYSEAEAIAELIMFLFL